MPIRDRTNGEVREAPRPGEAGIACAAAEAGTAELAGRARERELEALSA